MFNEHSLKKWHLRSDHCECDQIFPVNWTLVLSRICLFIFFVKCYYFYFLWSVYLSSSLFGSCSFSFSICDLILWTNKYLFICLTLQYFLGIEFTAELLFHWFLIDNFFNKTNARTSAQHGVGKAPWNSFVVWFFLRRTTAATAVVGGSLSRRLLDKQFEDSLRPLHER